MCMVFLKSFLSDKPLFGDVADDFLSFIDGAKLIIHNAKFDVNFLNHELEQVGKKLVQWDAVIDTPYSCTHDVPRSTK